jgi:hypothetical protein
LANQNFSKVLAYELGCDVCWDIGLPPKSDPNYISAALKTERAECRKIGLLYDAWLDRCDFPDVDIEFCFPPSPGYNVYCQGKTKINVPTPVPFVGLILYLPVLDYPYNDKDWPMVSPGMLEVLESVGDFKHNVYPTIINDASTDDPPGVNESFLILQTLEFLDAFDFDKSEYVMDTELDGRVDEANKVVLKEPLGGLPPVFRLNVKKSLLFVSAAAKEALEKSGKCGGAEFTPVDEDYHWY